MTETACTITLTLPEDTTSGHVGGPAPCCEVKLADIPEMNYLASDLPQPARGGLRPRADRVPGLPQGRGADQEILDDEGWLHTGRRRDVASGGKAEDHRPEEKHLQAGAR